MGTEIATGAWTRLMRQVQSYVPPWDAALFIARYLAWHLMTIEQPSPGDRVSVRVADLRAAWRDLESNPGPGAWQYAFYGSGSFPYERLPDSLVDQMQINALTFLLGAGPEDRRALANIAFDTLLQVSAGGPSEMPQEVAELCVRLTGVAAGDRVLCAGEAVSSFAVAVMQADANPIVVTPSPPVLAALYGAITLQQFDVELRDPLAFAFGDQPVTTRVDKALVAPAFGKRVDREGPAAAMFSRFGLRTSEGLGLELAAVATKTPTAVVVPNGVLFARGAESRLRERLVETGRLLGVIALPGGLLRRSALPLNVVVLASLEQFSDSPSGLRLYSVDERFVSGTGKLRSRDRRLIDVASIVREFLDGASMPDPVRVSREDVAAQDYCLLPSRYPARPLLAPGASSGKIVQLGDLATITKPQFIAAVEGEGIPIQEANPSDFPEAGYLERVVRTRLVDPKLLKARADQCLRANDVLLSTKGTIGKVAIVGPQHAEHLLPSQASVIVRVQVGPGVDPRGLAMYLKSPAVQRILQALAVGTTVGNIPLGDLRQLAVNVDVLARLAAAFELESERQRRIEQLQHEQHEAREAVWREAGLASPVGE